MTPASKPELPQHIAIVMDGNNRWAKSHDLPAKFGHRNGADAAREVVNSCLSRDIKYLTLFAFSSENWLRPRKEVQGLMALFLTVLKRKEINQLHKENVRLLFIGNRSSFSQKLQKNMREVEELTRNNTGMTVIVAADYGGRWDIANAMTSIVAKAASGELSADAIDIELVRQHTSTSDYPDPDLCIRTGGEHRISNFLLWQFAYTELYFTDCYWPDFGDAQFQLALDDFAKRQRRYGSHDEQETTSD
ncbi:MAG: polyprenyl diphosphate synthase [Gammaproteobacteria bacterium]|jgi:undecaprenyl diphosphate synthase|nr:polyprenyl diphosphate synthase [Gammaproteobacteria bacterium]